MTVEASGRGAYDCGGVRKGRVRLGRWAEGGCATVGVCGRGVVRPWRWAEGALRDRGGGRKGRCATVRVGGKGHV